MMQEVSETVTEGSGKEGAGWGTSQLVSTKLN